MPEMIVDVLTAVKTNHCLKGFRKFIFIFWLFWIYLSFIILKNPNDLHNDGLFLSRYQNIFLW